MPMRGVQLPQGVQIGRRAMREFEHEMIGAQRLRNAISAVQSPF